jgi:Fe-S-cluster containining protein
MTRVALPIVDTRPALKECTDCAKCCTYVAVGVNPPDSLRRATDLLWYLYHEDITLYIDGDGEWSVVFESRCRNLRGDMLCGVYEHRPDICRDFDNTTCDVNDPEGGTDLRTPAEYLAWLARRRPRLHAKLVARYLPPAAATGEPLPVPAAVARRRR